MKRGISTARNGSAAAAGSPGYYIIVCMSCNHAPDCTKWYLDSGASNHFCFDRNMFVSIQPLEKPNFVILGDDCTCPIQGKGMVHLKLASGSIFELHGVLYVPELTKNLLSTIASGQLRLYRIIIEDDLAQIVRKSDPENVLMTGHPYRGLVLLDAVSVPQAQMKFLMHRTTDSQLTKLWHYRLGHILLSKLKKLAMGDVVTGLPPFIISSLPTCEPCLRGKQH